jgi:malic enzyme
MKDLIPEDKATAFLAELSKRAEADLTEGFIQSVPDRCDRILWKNSYYHLPPIHDIEAIEDRVAEACAKVAIEQQQDGECPERATYIAEAIRSGEWRKYKWTN